MPPLVFGGRFVINNLTLGDFLRFFTDHVRATEEQVLPPVFRGDEAEAFGVAKPFYGSLCQWWSPCFDSPGLFLLKIVGTQRNPVHVVVMITARGEKGRKQ